MDGRSTLVHNAAPTQLSARLLPACGLCLSRNMHVLHQYPVLFSIDIWRFLFISCIFGLLAKFIPRLLQLSWCHLQSSEAVGAFLFAKSVPLNSSSISVFGLYGNNSNNRILIKALNSSNTDIVMSDSTIYTCIIELNNCFS